MRGGQAAVQAQGHHALQAAAVAGQKLLPRLGVAALGPPQQVLGIRFLAGRHWPHPLRRVAPYDESCKAAVEDAGISPARTEW
jgi:hypothetical protein